MLKKLTKNEGKVLRFIYDNGQPTYREIADGLGLSDVTSAVYIVNALIAKRLLVKGKGHSSRALKITVDGYLQIPDFVGDLKKYFDKEKVKISFPEEFIVSGVATPQKLSTNYWQSMRRDGTEFQEVPDEIKIAVNYLLAHFSVNGTMKNSLDSGKVKSAASLLYKTGMLPIFSWAIVLMPVYLASDTDSLIKLSLYILALIFIYAIFYHRKEEI